MVPSLTAAMPDLEAAKQFLKVLDPRGIFTFVTFADEREESSLTRQLDGRFPLLNLLQWNTVRLLVTFKIRVVLGRL